jgi:hypothetical protein
MIGVFVQFPNAPLPLHETVVKKPGSCPEEERMLDVPSADRVVTGGIWKV